MAQDSFGDLGRPQKKTLWAVSPRSDGNIRGECGGKAPVDGRSGPFSFILA
jgi:hypothetical protein